MPPAAAPAYRTDFDPQTGRPIVAGPGIVRVTAPNGGPFTFTGTNSFILGDETVAVLDPGPDDESHLKALLGAIGGRQVEAILLTHTHRDHCGLAAKLGRATGAPLWFSGPHRLSRPARPFEVNGTGKSSDFSLRPARMLADGEVFTAGGIALEAIATPGHCDNHFAFGLAGTRICLTGDHVMGWNSSLVSVPDGSMAAYLHSLEKLIGMPYGLYLPAHGGPIPDGPTYARALLAHRQARNEQIVEAVEAGAHTITKLLVAIYPRLTPQLIGAARMTIKAHVEYLAETGRIGMRRGLFGPRLFALRG
ncbi:MBL fold metallo-hydrolase [Arsenicitalea aurantiaca]|uniref:MBL fold metallo-hydrolase n=1 Tax=Arsenicitalea aurantiaca TaxID=1783274 RepID=A0A433XAI8_9HYPH|nr:MBL fold metallo-hydrolase [Arsenicitalea aurantiaca]RUT31107.1 MBL fold metallo-hydrolase [Arsenicitalea aurantiaca]